MSKEGYTLIADAVASAATIAVGIWIRPEYREFALAVFGLLQTVTGVLIVEFRNQRKIEALSMQMRQLTRRM